MAAKRIVPHDIIDPDKAAKLRQMAEQPAEDQHVATVNEVLDAWQAWAKTYYKRSADSPRSAHDLNCRAPIRRFREAAGLADPDKINSAFLIAWRDALADSGKLCRKEVNRHLGVIKRIIRWAAERRMVPAKVWAEAQVVKGVGVGRSKAYETERVDPVPWQIVAKTMPHLAPHYRSFVACMYFSGARSGELVGLRVSDIQFNDEIWIAEVSDHKNSHRGHRRILVFDHSAQRALAPLILGRRPDAYVWDAAEVSAWHRLNKMATRTTPLASGNKAGVNRLHPLDLNSRPLKRSGVALAIRRACKAGNISHWHPHQLRHSAARRWVQLHGQTVAQTLLGHKSPAMTSHYAEHASDDLRIAMDALANGRATNNSPMAKLIGGAA